MIELVRVPNGDRSVYNVMADGELLCSTCNDDDGMKLMVAIRKLEAGRAILPDLTSEFAGFGKFDRLAGVKSE